MTNSLIRTIRWICTSYRGIIIGPLIGTISGFSVYAFGMNANMSKVVGLTFLMMTWWLSRVVNMGITGLLPIVLLPLLGVQSGTKVSEKYFSNGIVICWCTLLMASAVEKYGLHTRIAFIFIRYVNSGSERFILLGFILITGFLSMWLSNTATAALMLPLSSAVISELRSRLQKKYQHLEGELDSDIYQQCIHNLDNLATGIDLSIAFSSSIGGTSTITGTGSNLVLQGIMLTIFGMEGQVTFFTWLKIATPLAILNLFVLWCILVLLYTNRNKCNQNNSNNHNNIDSNSNVVVQNPILLRRLPTIVWNAIINQSRTNSYTAANTDFENNSNINNDCINECPSANNEMSDIKYNSKLSYPEVIVIIVFTTMALLWITRDPPGGWGWKNIFSEPNYITDGTVAMFCCIVLFITPSKPHLKIINYLIQCYYYYSFSNAYIRENNVINNIELTTTNNDIIRNNLNSNNFNNNSNNDNNNNNNSNNDNNNNNNINNNNNNKLKYINLSTYTLQNEEHKSNDDNIEIHRVENNSFNNEDYDGNNNNSDTVLNHGRNSSIDLNNNSANSNNIISSSVINNNNSISISNSRYILEWDAVQNLNWNIIFLLGGGFALSSAFQDSGLSAWLANIINNYGPNSILELIITVCIIITGVTNVMSNVAASSIFLSALACVGPKHFLQPIYVLTPVTIAASLAFLFPIGTPPNAIILSNGNVTLIQMFCTGLLCTILCLTMTILYCIYIIPLCVYNIHNVNSHILETCN